MKRPSHIRLVIAAFISILVASLTPTHAEALSWGELFELCTSTELFANTACRFFIYGAVHGISFGDGAVLGPDNQFAERTRTHFCIPDDMPQSTMVSTVLNWTKLDLAKYPEDARLPAVTGVDVAMITAYPCTKTK